VTGSGTGAGVRNMGFTAPAAGKTGTDHDAWFAGFTSNLLCIVWVGNDDYTDIKLQGAQAAAPIWAAFMKRAVQLPQYFRHQQLHRARGRGDCLDSTASATCSATPHARPVSMRPSSPAPRPPRPATTPPSIATCCKKSSAWAKTAINHSAATDRAPSDLSSRPERSGVEEPVVVLLLTGA